MAALTDDILKKYGPAVEAAVKALYPLEANRDPDSQIAILFDKFDPDAKVLKVADQTIFFNKLQKLLTAQNVESVKKALIDNPDLGLSAFMKTEEYKDKTADGNDLGDKQAILVELQNRRAVKAQANDVNRFTPAQRALVSALKTSFDLKVAVHQDALAARNQVTAIVKGLTDAGPTVENVEAALPALFGVTSDELAKNPDVKRAVQRLVIEKELEKFIIKADDPQFSPAVKQILFVNSQNFLTKMTDRAIQARPTKQTGTEVALSLQKQLANAYTKDEIRGALNAVISPAVVTEDQLEAVLAEKAFDFDRDLLKAGGDLDTTAPDNALINRLIQANQRAYFQAIQGKTPESVKKLIQDAKVALSRANREKNPDFSKLAQGLGGIGLGAVAEQVKANRALIKADTQLLPGIKLNLQQNVLQLNQLLKDGGDDALKELHKRTCAAAHHAVDPNAAFTAGGPGSVVEQFGILFPNVPLAQTQAMIVGNPPKPGIIAEFTPRQAYIKYAFKPNGEPDVNKPFQKTAALIASLDQTVQTPAAAGQPDPVTARMRGVFATLKPVTNKCASLEDYLNQAFENLSIGGEPAPDDFKRVFWDELHELITANVNARDVLGNASDVLLGPAVTAAAAGAHCSVADIAALDAARDELKAKAKERLATFGAVAASEADDRIKRYEKEIVKNKDVQRVFRVLRDAVASEELYLPSETNQQRLEGKQDFESYDKKQSEYDFIVARRDEFQKDILFIKRALEAMDQREKLGYVPNDKDKKHRERLENHDKELKYQRNQLNEAIAALDIARKALAAEGLAFYTADAQVEVRIAEVNKTDLKMQERDIRSIFTDVFHGTGRAMPTVSAGIGINPDRFGSEWEKRKWTQAQLDEGASAGNQKVALQIVKRVIEVSTPNPAGGEPTKSNREKVIGGFYHLPDEQGNPSVQRTYLSTSEPLSDQDIQVVMKKQAIQLVANWNKIGTGNSIILRCDGTANGLRAMQLLRKELLALNVPDNIIVFPKTVGKDNTFFGATGKETKEIKKLGKGTLEFKDAAKVAAGQMPEGEALERARDSFPTPTKGS